MDFSQTTTKTEWHSHLAVPAIGPQPGRGLRNLICSLYLDDSPNDHKNDPRHGAIIENEVAPRRQRTAKPDSPAEIKKTAELGCCACPSEEWAAPPDTTLLRARRSARVDTAMALLSVTNSRCKPAPAFATTPRRKNMRAWPPAKSSAPSASPPKPLDAANQARASSVSTSLTSATPLVLSPHAQNVVSNGSGSVFLIFAKTDPNAGESTARVAAKRHLGFPRRTHFKGSASAARRKMGQQLPSVEIIFNDCEFPPKSPREEGQASRSPSDPRRRPHRHPASSRLAQGAVDES